jgi:hypothetical protein
LVDDVAETHFVKRDGRRTTSDGPNNTAKPAKAKHRNNPASAGAPPNNAMFVT